MRNGMPPVMPAELDYALRVSVDGLRPWEYWGMEADEYDLILHLQGVYRREMQAGRDMVERQQARMGR
jgi:hypothetical protein